MPNGENEDEGMLRAGSEPTEDPAPDSTPPEQAPVIETPVYVAPEPTMEERVASVRAGILFLASKLGVSSEDMKALFPAL